jgi:hypothetical protein
MASNPRRDPFYHVIVTTSFFFCFPPLLISDKTFFVFCHDRFRTMSMRIATSEFGEEVGEDDDDS